MEQVFKAVRTLRKKDWRAVRTVWFLMGISTIVILSSLAEIFHLNVPPIVYPVIGVVVTGGLVLIQLFVVFRTKE